jgi:RNA methyltransferase, TrmH family
LRGKFNTKSLYHAINENLTFPKKFLYLKQLKFNMLTKNELKYYSSLLQKKARQKERRFLVEGVKLIQEGLNSNLKCEIIIHTKSFYDDNKQLFERGIFTACRIEILKSSDFKKLTDTKTPQEVAAVFQMPNRNSGSVLSGNIICALENISDPGNVGTILRNCDWFGIERVILDGNCAEVYNPKVIRASAGSVFHLDFFMQDDLYNFLTLQKQSGYNILCADLDGQNIYTYKNLGKGIIVLANEANGPTKQLLDISDTKVTIPRRGKAESLNVASASAVILSELTK